jgi:hypothetical protein
MRRREVITLLVGAAAMWPRGARAQQAKMPTIGFLGAGSGSDSVWKDWTAAFVQRLRELGWVEGRTLVIEYRWGEGRAERYADLAAEFVALKVDVIVTSGSAGGGSQGGNIGYSHSFRDSERTDRPSCKPGATGRQCDWDVLNKVALSVQINMKADLREIYGAPTRAAATAAIDMFADKYGAKYDKAVACLTKDREATLLAFFDFPAEHSDIKSDRSVFATVRHRTVRTKGALSAKSMPLRKRGND